jgi:hypothetical protein
MALIARSLLRNDSVRFRRYLRRGRCTVCTPVRDPEATFPTHPDCGSAITRALYSRSPDTLIPVLVGVQVRRRDFSVLGAAVGLWPVAARTQQPKAPVIGFLSSFSRGQSARPIAEFLRGLSENGFTDGQNVTMELTFADGRYDRLPALADGLVHRPAHRAPRMAGFRSYVGASQSERAGHGTLDQMYNDGRSVDYDKYRARRGYSPTQSRSRWNRVRDHLRWLAHISDCERG